MAVDFRTLKIESTPIGILKGYDRNSRTHSPEQVAQIAASIQAFGFTNPILVKPDLTIICGHGRLAGALKLGLSEVPCITLDGLSDTEIRALVISDNKIAENAGWDEAMLATELAALGELKFDIDLLGFSDDELAKLNNLGNTGLTDPDEVPPEPARAVTSVGDVWLLGDHRIMCGDGCDLEMVRRLTNGIVPDVANCDPPYGLSIVKSSSDGGAKPFGSKGKVGGGNAPYGGWKNGDRKQGAKLGREHGPARNAIIAPGLYAPIIGDDSTDTAIASYAALTDLSVPVIVLWGGNYFANSLPPSRCWLVWDKETNGNFADAELAWTNQDACTRLLRHQWSGLIKASERGERRVHPTQKPVALAEWVIDTVAAEAKTVIDLFLGSGSTLIAAERKGRQCFGTELSPIYVDVCVERWQQFTGKTATLEATGKTFSETADERYDWRIDGAESYDEWMKHKRNGG